MLGIHDLPLFVLSGLLLNIMPGPDSLLIMTRSAQQGWRAGAAASAGIGVGTLVHVFAAALGISAILAASAAAFTVVKFVGAAYILYMAWGLLRVRRAGHRPAAQSLQRRVDDPPYTTSMRKVFAQGFLTNVLNPKVALFFLAFVPQFIDADAPNKALAFIALGAIFDFNGMLWCLFLSVFTAKASARLKLSERTERVISRATGALFVWLGIKLALSKQA